MLAPLIAGPRAYQERAQEYIDVTVAIDPVAAIFNHALLSASLVRSLTPAAPAGVHADAVQIGYRGGAASPGELAMA